MSRRLKVLYIDGVGPFGGASRSLFEALNALPDNAVERFFVMQDGTARDFYARLAAGVITTRGLTRFDHSRASHYRGVRWIVPLREAVYFPYMLAALVKARKQWPDIDLIHANEIMEIIPGLIAKALFRVPLVIHTRSLQLTDMRLWRTRWYHRQLRRHVDAIVAIDEGVRATLPADLAVDVIHNSFSPRPSGRPDAAYLAQLDSLRPSSLKVGFVGNLHRHKGLHELFEAAKIVKSRGDDVQFLIVGGVTSQDRGLKWWLLDKLGLAQNMDAELRSAVANAGLEDDFRVLGPTNDIQRLYERMDVVAFPSHYDAPGRPVFEAAFYGVPSIVAVGTPRPDTLAAGETGIAIPRPDAALLADAITYFAKNRQETERMGRNAKALAEQNFTPKTNAATLYALYKRVVGPGRS